jgi:hypothetical protein
LKFLLAHSNPFMLRYYAHVAIGRRLLDSLVFIVRVLEANLSLLAEMGLKFRLTLQTLSLRGERGACTPVSLFRGVGLTDLGINAFEELQSFRSANRFLSRNLRRFGIRL